MGGLKSMVLKQKWFFMSQRSLIRASAVVSNMRTELKENTQHAHSVYTPLSQSSSKRLGSTDQH